MRWEFQWSFILKGEKDRIEVFLRGWGIGGFSLLSLIFHSFTLFCVFGRRRKASKLIE